MITPHASLTPVGEIECRHQRPDTQLYIEELVLHKQTAGYRVHIMFYYISKSCSFPRRSFSPPLLISSSICYVPPLAADAHLECGLKFILRALFPLKHI